LFLSSGEVKDTRAWYERYQLTCANPINYGNFGKLS
jgi:hypothetical protein